MLAQKFTAKRLVLLGESARVLPAFAAQGLNAFFADIHRTADHRALPRGRYVRVLKASDQFFDDLTPTTDDEYQGPRQSTHLSYLFE